MPEIKEELVDRVVVLVDLARYRNIAKDLDRQVGGKGVALLDLQIREMMDHALTAIGIAPQTVPSKVTGDGKKLVFESAERAHAFAESLHRVVDRRNQRSTVPLHHRHFRMGICSGEIVLQQMTSKDGELVGYEFTGMAIIDASRLEGSCVPGEILVCPETWARLPPDVKPLFGKEETIPIKHDDDLLGHRRKVVEPPASLRPPNASGPAPAAVSEPVEELLRRLVSTNVAPRAKGDLDLAVVRGLAGIDAVVAKALPPGSITKHLSLDDICDITAKAIGHGAGIYNAGSYVGCATIYLHAARNALEHLPCVAPAAHNAPSKGTHLAFEWLAGIATANPAVDESTADDLAWELRFAFDAIRQIPMLDRITTAVRLTCTASGNLDTDELMRIVEKAVAFSEQIMENHVRAYILRHTAAAILSIIGRCYRAQPAPPGPIAAWQQSLQPVIDANPRITRYNVPQLAAELPKLLRPLSGGGTRLGDMFGSN